MEDVVAKSSWLVFEDLVGDVRDGFAADDFLRIAAQGGHDVLEIFFVHELGVLASVN